MDESAWARNVEMARISPYLGTVHDLGLIVFNETQSNSDRPQKWSSTALPVEPSENALRNPAVRVAYESSMKAAREAHLSGTDPTNGAVYLNQRTHAGRGHRIMSEKNKEGVRLSTQSGPYNNSFPNKDTPSRTVWLDTYSPPDK